MAFAETQQLAVELNLTGNLRSAVPQAEQQLSGLNRVSGAAGQGAGLLSRGFGAVGSAASKVGGALSHAKNQLLGLVTGPLGMLGLGAGLFSIGGLFKSGTDKAREFGGEVKRLAAVTGLSVETTSRLAGAFDHFGIAADTVAKIAGLAEKNLFALTQTSTKAGSTNKQLTSAAEAVTRAQERLTVAEAKLTELRRKHGASDSALLAAEFKVRDATAALSAAQEKQVGVQGKIASSVNNASEFAKKYGLSLVDASGKVKDFNALLLDSADFWNNKTIPAQQKAAALNKIYGRSWQDLIPILGAGRAGITAAEEEAARLGLTITKDNIDALSKAKEATRTWTDALGGLKLQIGFAVMPTLTALTKGLTVLVVANRERIVGFIRGIADAGQTLASAFGTYVVPALSSVVSIFSTMSGAAGGLSFVTILSESANFAKDLGAALNGVVVPAIKAVVGGWNALPDQLRTLLIEGFIANKVVKWTFGFDAVGFGLHMAQSFIANVAGKLTADVAGSLAAVGIGKAFIQPVFVTNPGFGVPGIAPLPAAAGAAEGAGLVGAGGLAGLVGTIVPLVLPLVITGAVVAAIFALTPSGATIPHDPATRPVGGRAPNWTPSNPLPVSDAKAAEASRQFDAAQTNAFSDQSTAMVTAFNQTAGFLRSQRERPDTARIDFSRLGPILRSSLDPLIATLRASKGEAEIRKAADALAAAVKAQQGRGTLTAGTAGLGVKELKDSLVALQAKQAAALKAGNTALAAALGKDIKAVEKKLPERAFVAKELATEEQILRSSESSKQKLGDLTSIQRALQQHGDTKAAAIVSRAIADMKNRLARTTAQAGEVAAAAIRHKKQLVDVNVQNTISVSTTVSARQVRTAEVVVQRYGTNRIGWT